MFLQKLLCLSVMSRLTNYSSSFSQTSRPMLLPFIRFRPRWTGIVPFCLHPLRILTWKAPSATTHGQCDVNPNYAAESKSCENCFLSFIQPMKHLCSSSVFSWNPCVSKTGSQCFRYTPNISWQYITMSYNVLQCTAMYYNILLYWQYNMLQ